MKASDLEITVVPLDSLRPDPRNAKHHSQVQVAQIAASIQKFGFADPLGVVTSGNGFRIVEGHGRFLAAQLLKLETVPVIKLDHLSREEVRAYAIAHNQTQLLTALDLDKVSAEFTRLDVAEAEYGALGFTASDMLFLAPENRDILEDDSIGSPTKDVEEWKDFVPPVVKSTVIFDNENQQIVWFQMIEALRGRFPNGVTHGERLVSFATEFMPED